MNHLRRNGLRVREDFIQDLHKAGMSQEEITEMYEDTESRSFLNAFCDLIAGGK
jgi:predicted metal-dependent phosphotriesterase family hydrolase